MIRVMVSPAPIDVAAEMTALEVGGAVATFTGLVREFSGSQQLSAMTLEHYPGMTEKQLAAIEAEALHLAGREEEDG